MELGIDGSRLKPGADQTKPLRGSNASILGTWFSVLIVVTSRGCYTGNVTPALWSTANKKAVDPCKWGRAVSCSWYHPTSPFGSNGLYLHGACAFARWSGSVTGATEPSAPSPSPPTDVRLRTRLG